jgi:hypothetical protein
MRERIVQRIQELELEIKEDQKSSSMEGVGDMIISKRGGIVELAQLLAEIDIDMLSSM